MRYDEFTLLPIRAFRPCGAAGCGYRMTLEGSKDSAPAPDYAPLAQASKESAEIMAKLGHEQLDESRRQYENNMAVVKPVVDAQLDTMRQTQQQGADYYDYLKTTFRPIEEGLAKDAVNFSEAGAREQFARTAASDLEQQQANEQAQSDRAMAAAGVNPNSGRFAGLKRSQIILNAGARAGAMTDARVRADALGTAKRMDVVGLSRNLPGASAAAYGVATGAGSSAVGNQMAPSGQLLNGMAQGAGTIGQGQSMRIQGLGSILGAETSYANATSGDGGMGAALVGAAGSIGAAAFI